MKKFIPQLVVTGIAVMALIIGADGVGPSKEAATIVCFVVVALVALAAFAVINEQVERDRQKQNDRHRWALENKLEQLEREVRRPGRGR